MVEMSTVLDALHGSRIAPVVTMRRMRAAGIEAFGGDVGMLELPAPTSPAPDEVVISVCGAGVGNWDEIVRDVASLKPTSHQSSRDSIVYHTLRRRRSENGVSVTRFSRRAWVEPLRKTRSPRPGI
jgi:hypothetical protein